MPAALLVVLAGVGVLWWRFQATPPAVGLQFPFDLIYLFVPLAEQTAAALFARRSFLMRSASSVVEMACV